MRRLGCDPRLVNRSPYWKSRTRNGSGARASAVPLNEPNSIRSYWRWCSMSEIQAAGSDDGFFGGDDLSPHVLRGAYGRFSSGVAAVCAVIDGEPAGARSQLLGVSVARTSTGVRVRSPHVNNMASAPTSPNSGCQCAGQRPRVDRSGTRVASARSIRGNRLGSRQFRGRLHCRRSPVDELFDLRAGSGG